MYFGSKFKGEFRVQLDISDEAFVYIAVINTYFSHGWFHLWLGSENGLQTYKYLQKCASAWYCLKCYEELIPFTTVTNKELYQTNQGQKIKYTVVTKMVSPS